MSLEIKQVEPQDSVVLSREGFKNLVENEIIAVNDQGNPLSATYQGIANKHGLDPSRVFRYVNDASETKPWLLLVAGPNTKRAGRYQTFEQYLAVRPKHLPPLKNMPPVLSQAPAQPDFSMFRTSGASHVSTQASQLAAMAPVISPAAQAADPSRLLAGLLYASPEDAKANIIRAMTQVEFSARLAWLQARADVCGMDVREKIDEICRLAESLIRGMTNTRED